MDTLLSNNLPWIFALYIVCCIPCASGIIYHTYTNYKTTHRNTYILHMFDQLLYFYSNRLKKWCSCFINTVVHFSMFKCELCPLEMQIILIRWPNLLEDKYQYIGLRFNCHFLWHEMQYHLKCKLAEKVEQLQVQCLANTVCRLSCQQWQGNPQIEELNILWGQLQCLCGISGFPPG